MVLADKDFAMKLLSSIRRILSVGAKASSSIGYLPILRSLLSSPRRKTRYNKQHRDFILIIMSHFVQNHTMNHEGGGIEILVRMAPPYSSSLMNISPNTPALISPNTPALT